MLLWQKVFSFVKGYNKSRDAVLYVVVTVSAAVYYFEYYLVKKLNGPSYCVEEATNGHV